MRRSEEPQSIAKLKKELLEAIAMKMEADQISQGEISRRIGTDRSNVTNILRRNANASLDLLVRMAESIGLKVDIKVKDTKA